MKNKLGVTSLIFAIFPWIILWITSFPVIANYMLSRPVRAILTDNFVLGFYYLLVATGIIFSIASLLFNSKKFYGILSIISLVLFAVFLFSLILG